VVSRRETLQLLSQTLARESHVLVGDAGSTTSHLHNMLFLDHGDDGPSARMLPRARQALGGRVWLRLRNRPAAARTAAIRVLDQGAPVTAVAWSGDQRLLASGDVDGVVRLWDWERGTRLEELRRASAVTSVCWSPAGTLASGHRDGTVWTWDPPAWSHENLWVAPSVPEEGSDVLLAWSVSGSLALSSGSVVDVWDRSGRWRERDLRFPVSSLAWSPDGSRLAFASPSGHGSPLAPVIGWWEPAADRQQLILQAEDDWFDVVAWLPDGRSLLAGGGPGTLACWSLALEETAFSVTEPQGGNGVLAVSPDGLSFASARDGAVVRIWDVSGLPRAGLRGVLAGHRRGVTCLAWSPDAGVLASGSRDGTVRLWDPTAATIADRGEAGSISEVGAVAWSPAGETLAAANPEGIALLEAESGRRVELLRPPENGDPVGIALTVEWSPRGSHLALRDDFYGGTSIRLVGLEDDEWLTLATSRDCFAWSPEGATLAADAGEYVLLVDAASGRRRLLQARSGLEDVIRAGLYGLIRRRRILSGHTEDMAALAWSPSGVRLATGGYDGSVVVWDPDRWRGARARFLGPKATVDVLAWSPDGSALAWAAGDLVYIWEPGRERRPRSLPMPAWALAWSPDGRLLAAGSHGVGLIDGETGERVATTDDDPAIAGLAWLDESGVLAAACHDGTVRVWDAATGRRLGTAHCLAAPRALWVDAGGRILKAADDGAATDNRPVPYVFEVCRAEGEP
jgi:WD40 repeat protein